ncbi:MAG: 6-bladed beta-propeller [marine benthic group bacterium]|nr:6-bladed beta-propeller [Gemmatimonadota bacterium]
MSRILRSASLPIIALLTTACGPGADNSGSDALRWQAAIDTIADTVVVRTVAGQMWESDRQLVSEVSIGVLEGDEKYQFGRLRAIAVDLNGNMYAFDSHVPVLRVYGPDGAWLRDIGREGEGPGEYKQPDAGLAMLRDGRVALRDPGNGRITLYKPDGAYDGFYRIAGSFNTSSPLTADTTGTLLTPTVVNLGESVFEWKSGLARYFLDGSVDTLMVPDLGYEEAQVSAEREGSMSINGVPFAPEQVTAYSPKGYFLVGISEDYAFDLLRPEGVLRIQKAYEPVAVYPGEADAEREATTDNFKQNYPGWKWNGPPIPDVKPAYDGFYPAEDGRIWVHVPAPSERYMDAEDQKAEEERLGRAVNPYRAPVLFDVFEPTGEYLGQVSTPEGFSLRPKPIFRGDNVWATVRDEYDVQRLHRFRMEAITTD